MTVKKKNLNIILTGNECVCACECPCSHSVLKRVGGSILTKPSHTYNNFVKTHLSKLPLY